LYANAKGESAPQLEPLEVTCNFDSYMLTDKFLKTFKKKARKPLRLLAVDNKLYLPVETNIRLLVTAADVLHS